MDAIDTFPWVMGFFGLLVLGVMGGVVYDLTFCEPVAAEKANEICREQGFDFYEGFSRIGFFSKVPVAIKCEFVEQYRQIDINKPIVEINQ